ncbi:minor capsid protein [Methylorubrum extorquens]|uniref:minor capsid protein n=1 Tax=Methylorubrum extorquens TaxID=408 RepID=UPI00209F8EDB|nr:minor capsid protein [Methylorubrum extorquens]MCP1540060.1 hypothetical protein [Methylorubrum extorquens]
MRLDLLADFLELRGIGTPGIDIFEDQMPADCRTGVLLKLPLQGIDIDHELPGYFRGKVQAIVRAQKAEDGDRLAKRVMDALTLYRHGLVDKEGREVLFINHMRPKTLPIIYPRSEGNGKEWSINMDASYVLR